VQENKALCSMLKTCDNSKTIFATEFLLATTCNILDYNPIVCHTRALLGHSKIKCMISSWGLSHKTQTCVQFMSWSSSLILVGKQFRQTCQKNIYLRRNLGLPNQLPPTLCLVLIWVVYLIDTIFIDTFDRTRSILL